MVELLAHRHFRFGWWSLCFFVMLGILLEALHAFKIGWYLDVSSSTRRLMLTLGHAHGSLLGIVHVVFALSIRGLDVGDARRWLRFASASLIGAGILLPGGLLLGGVVIYAGDPGVGAFLVPLGALLLLVAIFLTAWRFRPTA